MSDHGASTALVELEDHSATTVERAGKDMFGRAAVLTAHMALSRAFARGITDAMTSPPLVEYVQNATNAGDYGQELATDVDRLFRRWQDLRFEDGMENDVSRKLWRLLMIHSSILITALASIIAVEKTNPRVAAEALRHLGRFIHPPSHRDRLWLLEWGLHLSSPMSRDGASLGLAHLNDPAAIPYLQAAIDAEPIESLKEDLKQVLAGLNNAAASQTK